MPCYNEDKNAVFRVRWCAAFAQSGNTFSQGLFDHKVFLFTTPRRHNSGRGALRTMRPSRSSTVSQRSDVGFDSHSWSMATCPLSLRTTSQFVQARLCTSTWYANRASVVGMPMLKLWPDEYDMEKVELFGEMNAHVDRDDPGESLNQLC